MLKIPFIQMNDPGDQLKKELSLPWGNIGMLNILPVLSVRNLSWGTSIMSRMAKLTVTFITINFLVLFAIIAMV